MKIVYFSHSLLSDWNHGNAHFLRGVASELVERGHDVQVFEPRDAWSVQNLVAEKGENALQEWKRFYPLLAHSSTRYDLETLDLDDALRDADLVIVHEWNDHDLVARIGRHRKNHAYKLLFHDTHHRAVTERASLAKYNLENYDGVLAFGQVIRDLYLQNQWTRRAWTWHEAADTRIFYPMRNDEYGTMNEEAAASSFISHPSSFVGDLVWIGNWGDDERTRELHEFLLEPVKELGLKARVHGVRYPDQAKTALRESGIEYSNWLPNYRAPAVFAQFKVTVHVPRRPYVESLPGIPTIRPFEALACGIPLVSAPWNDCEHLFSPGEDFLVARNGEEMKHQLRRVLNEPQLAQSLVQHGLKTIQARHTCAHRVDELLSIYNEL
jgi:spore maturation protein CgeB